MPTCERGLAGGGSHVHFTHSRDDRCLPASPQLFALSDETRRVAPQTSSASEGSECSHDGQACGSIPTTATLARPRAVLGLHPGDRNEIAVTRWPSRHGPLTH